MNWIQPPIDIGGMIITLAIIIGVCYIAGKVIDLFKQNR